MAVRLGTGARLSGGVRRLGIRNPQRRGAIAAGLGHTCALTTAGGIKCWGSNGHDELGDGSKVDSVKPVDVAGLTSGVTAIANGVRHSCALTSAGAVKCWGNNGQGELGDGSSVRRFTAVEVAGLSSGVTAIAAGSDHTCALTTAGGVKCWGYNRWGELGDGTTNDRSTPVDVVGLSSGVKAISAGGIRSCALTSTGGVKCWGGSTSVGSRTPVEIQGLGSGVTAISAGQPSCALTSAGGVKCWGATSTDPWTPADVPGLASGVTAIAAGGGHACALMTGGGVKCWGLNDVGELGDGTTTTRATPADVTGLTSGVIAITAGTFHSCALVKTGAVKCWGLNSNGQLGDRTTVNRSTPVGVSASGRRPRSPSSRLQ